jgi:hypothetical protein
MNLNTIAEELFAKIRGIFPSVTLGDEEGNVTTEPADARFYEFTFNNAGKDAGKVSITLDDENGVTIMYNDNVAADDISKNKWYSFLKELRTFSKKRMLNFDVRNISKSNLEKRDYKYLAKSSGDDNMNESKLYGTSKLSYQDVDSARIVIRHTENINTEVPAGRTRNIGAIYIESDQGERFKYPFKHLAGARAMARHVAEGGTTYDEFGSHIVDLSEEMNKLRKFKNYMGRSSVMAESLADYVGVVHERISTVKKRIDSLQKKNYYQEAFSSYEKPVFEDIPNDVQENWIDQLTIRQFNEELKDVFPYIYKLIGEATRAKQLGPEDFMAEVAGSESCWDGYKKDGTQAGTGKNKGQRVNKCVPEDSMAEMEEASGSKIACLGCDEVSTAKAWEKNKNFCPKCKKSNKGVAEGQEVKEIEGYFNELMGQWAEDEEEEYCCDGCASGEGCENDEEEYADEQEDAPQPQQTPLGEFILSFYDRHTGSFPKGETAVLTMVEKDYGEQFIDPAKTFIERVSQTFEQYNVRSDSGQMTKDKNTDEGMFDRFKKKPKAQGTPLPNKTVTIKVGGHAVKLEPDDNGYIGFTWHDSSGQEHYEESPVGPGGDRGVATMEELIDIIKGEIKYIEDSLARSPDNEEFDRIRQLAGL